MATLPAHAQTWNTIADGFISQKVFASGYDATRLNVVDSSYSNNLLYVDIDVSMNAGMSNWESATWITHTPIGGRLPATLQGVDTTAQNVSSFPRVDRRIVLRNLTLERVDLDTDNVQFAFQPAAGDTAFTLNDASITGAQPPSLYVPAHFTMSAFGDSMVSDWSGSMGSVTTLAVQAGSTLTFKDSGDVFATTLNDRLYFSAYGNDLHVNGGTLVVNQSSIQWGRRPLAGEAHSSIDVNGGGTLFLDGFRSRIDASDITLTGGTLKLGFNTVAEAAWDLRLDGGAIVSLGGSGQAVAAGLTVSGQSSITAMDPAFGASVDTFVLDLRPGARLTLQGDGAVHVAGPVTYTPGAAGKGQIHVTGTTALVLRDQASMVLRDGNVLTTTASGASSQSVLQVTRGAELLILPTHQLTNDGIVDVATGGTFYVDGVVTIPGGSDGWLTVGDDGALAMSAASATPGHNALTLTRNSLEFSSFGSLAMTLDPAHLTNDRITVGGELRVSALATLTLSVTDDAPLPVGHKLVLIDYPATQGPLPASSHFAGHAPNHVFKLGANWFQIRYYDPAYSTKQPTVVTLTVVPDPAVVPSLLPATQDLTGTVGTRLTPSAALAASNFAGSVTYSISPSLPVGLAFDTGNAVISGVPAFAQGTTSYAIHGADAGGGVATATVTVTIAKGTPPALVLFANPASIAPGGTSALATTGGAGMGTISYAVAGPCTVAGATLTGGAAGTCTVVATQAADANYAAGQSNTVTVDVGRASQAPLVLTATPPTLTVGSSTTLAVAGGSGTGAVAYVVESGACTVAGNIVRATAAGSCEITATKAGDADFAPASSNRLLLVVALNPAPALLLTAAPASIAPGGTSTLVASGGIPGAPIVFSVTGPCGVAGGVLTGSGAGSCVVTATQAATAVFAGAASQPATIVVVAAAATVSYAPATAYVGVYFRLQPTQSGFTAPIFAVIAGNLPPGLVLDPVTGAISGVPTGPGGRADAVVGVHDTSASAQAAVAIVVSDGITAVPVLDAAGLLVLAALLVLTAAWHRPPS